MQNLENSVFKQMQSIKEDHMLETKQTHSMLRLIEDNLNSQFKEQVTQLSSRLDDHILPTIQSQIETQFTELQSKLESKFEAIPAQMEPQKVQMVEVERHEDDESTPVETFGPRRKRMEEEEDK